MLPEIKVSTTLVRLIMTGYIVAGINMAELPKKPLNLTHHIIKRTKVSHSTRLNYKQNLSYVSFIIRKYQNQYLKLVSEKLWTDLGEVNLREYHVLWVVGLWETDRVKYVPCWVEGIVENIVPGQ